MVLSQEKTLVNTRTVLPLVWKMHPKLFLLSKLIWITTPYSVCTNISHSSTSSLSIPSLPSLQQRTIPCSRGSSWSTRHWSLTFRLVWDRGWLSSWNFQCSDPGVSPASLWASGVSSASPGGSGKMPSDIGRSFLLERDRYQPFQSHTFCCMPLKSVGKF